MIIPKFTGACCAIAGRGLALALTSLTLGGCGRGDARESAGADSALVQVQSFTVWSPYDGVLNARRQDLIMSALSGPGTVVELAIEGSVVQAGDRLVRFDDADLERELVNLQRDYDVAQADYDGLAKARLPLDLRVLKEKVQEARDAYDEEEAYLADCVRLAGEDLLSPQELAAQRAITARRQGNLAGLLEELQYTEQYLQPAQLMRANATRVAAQQALRLAREQQEHCDMRAPSEGMVIYLPAQLGTEYRTARIGDSVFRNQAFLAVANMSNAVVQCLVPEAELAVVAVGLPAQVIPLAFPDARIPAEVETVGSMAQSVPSKPAWQKYFRVQIGLQDRDARLRPGMSVQVLIQSYTREDALVVPRSAMWWEDGEARCRVKGLVRDEVRTVTVGHCNHQYFEILAGLKAGERVACL